MDVGENPVGVIDVVLRDVFPNLVEIGERIGMENVVAHPPDRRRSLFSRSFLNAYELAHRRRGRSPEPWDPALRSLEDQRRLALRRGIQDRSSIVLGEHRHESARPRASDLRPKLEPHCIRRLLPD